MSQFIECSLHQEKFQSFFTKNIQIEFRLLAGKISKDTTVKKSLSV